MPNPRALVESHNDEANDAYTPIHQVASGLGLKDDIERRLSRPAHR
jgi:hypothetical protein